MLNAKFCRSNLVVEQIESIPYITNMWQVYTRLNSASDFCSPFYFIEVFSTEIEVRSFLAQVRLTSDLLDQGSNPEFTMNVLHVKLVHYKLKNSVHS
jgi:hypothetical protein